MPPPAARRTWPLRRLVLLWALLLAVVLLATFFLSALREAELSAWQRAHAKAAAESARISVVAERLVATEPSVVTEMLVYAVLQDDASIALVADPRLNIVASARAADRGLSLEWAHPELHRLLVERGVGERVQAIEDRDAGTLRVMRSLQWPLAPGEVRSTARGTLWLQVDVARMVERQRDQAVRAHLVEGLVLAMGALLLLVGLDYGVLRPVARLRAAAERLGAGEVAALQPSRVREIESLGQALLRSGADLQTTLRRVQEREQRFRALSASAPDAIITLDGMGRIDHFNEAAERLFGYRADEIVGSTLGPLLPEGTEALHAQHVRGFEAEPVGTARHMQSGRLVRGRHRSGRNLHLEVGISRSRLDDSVQFTAVVRDVSERMAVEAELETHRRGLEELVRRRTAELLQERDRSQTATRAKNEFLARIGHELRTPMNTVLGMSHLLRQQLSGAQATRVLALDNAARQLHGLLEDILDFTRLEAGQLSLAPSSTELRPLLTAVVESSWPAQQPGSVELVLWIDADVPRQVVIDGLRLRQVLGHLLGNALKFTASGHVTLRVSVADAGRAASPAIRFEVSDTGIGISPGMQQRIFEPFEQADGSDTRGYGGAGIGLVICQRLLALMNGELQLQSEPGRGSRFGFTLQCPVDRDALSGTRAPFAGRALVLDALADARAAQAESLRTLGYVTDTADDPLTAQRVLRAAAHRGEPVDWVLVGARQAAAAMALPTDPLLQGLQPPPRWLLALPADAAPPLADVLRAGYTGLLVKPVLGETLAAQLRARTPGPAPLPAADEAPPAADELPEPLRRLARVASLDVARGLRSTLGDPAAYRRLLDSFARFHGADPQRLRDAAQHADADRVRAVAHSLTSAAGAIGAQRIQLLSQGLARRGGPLDAEAQGMVAELAGELQVLIEALALAQAPGPAVLAPAPPAGDVAARRDELRRHLEGRDMVALRWLQSVGDAELAALGVPPAPLRHAVMAFDYDAALEMLALAERGHAH